MATTPPIPGPIPGQRTLAAIVFTDVVGFSARMQIDEVATVKLLQRDFAEMRRLCAEHEGAVLKTTGDGLLLTFTSAVQAVACALAMQRQFAAEARAGGGADDPLKHRIGIHLGDVLVQDKDVMGDGVNIAARLQAEAEPGGICISQTVYDVVKNKVQMQAVNLGPRDLKNIAQAMPVYHLLLEAQTLGAAGLSRPPPPPAPAPAPSTRRGFFIGVGAAVALGVVFAAGYLLNRRGDQPAPAPVAATLPATAARTEAEADTEPDTPKRKALMQQVHAQFLAKYDFEGFARFMHDKGEATAGRPATTYLLRAADQLVALKEWLGFELQHYNRMKPLVVHDLSADATQEIHVFISPDRRLVFLENGAPKPREWTDLKPAVFGAIIVSALHETKPSAPREVTLGAQAFARLYALMPMQEALGFAKTAHEKETHPK